MLRVGLVVFVGIFLGLIILPVISSTLMHGALYDMAQDHKGNILTDDLIGNILLMWDAAPIVFVLSLLGLMIMTAYMFSHYSRQM